MFIAFSCLLQRIVEKAATQTHTMRHTHSDIHRATHTYIHRATHTYMHTATHTYHHLLVTVMHDLMFKDEMTNTARGVRCGKTPPRNFHRSLL